MVVALFVLEAVVSRKVVSFELAEVFLNESFLIFP